MASSYSSLVRSPAPRQTGLDETMQAYANILDARNAKEARAARVIGRDIGLPGNTVEADLPGFEAERNNTDIWGMLTGDRHLSSFTSDPHNAAAVKDDLPSLASMSAIFKLSDSSNGSDLINNMKKQQQPKSLLTAFDMLPTKPPVNYDFKNVQVPDFENAPYVRQDRPGRHVSAFEGGLGMLNVTADETLRGGLIYLADAIGKGETFRGSQYYKNLSEDIDVQGAIAAEPDISMSERGNWLGARAYEAAQSLELMGLSILTKRPVAAMGIQQGLQQYSDVRARGGTPNEALASGTVYGVAESAFEKYFGLGWMLGNFGKKATGKFLGGLLLREVPGEMATTAVQDLADAMVTGGGGWEQYKKELPSDLLNTAASTAIMVGMVGGGHYVARSLRPQADAVQQIERAAAGGEFLDNLANLAEQSKVKKEDPETLRDFIDQRAEATPVRNVYVPVENVVQYMQSDAYKGEFDRYQPQIGEAQATNGDVVIPIGDAVAHIAGTPAWDALKDDMRVEPGGLSRNEAKQQHEDIIHVLEQRGKEIAQEAQTNEATVSDAAKVYEEVKNRLRSAGIDERQADATAQIYAARYEARASRMGGTAMEQFKRSKIVFPGEGEEAAGRQFAQQPDTVVNIGLNVFPALGGGTVAPEEAIKALKDQGVEVTHSEIRQSGTEPTLVARLSKPLTKKQGNAVSTALRQEAIAQRSGTKGSLFGPAAQKWAPFDPAYFIEPKMARSAQEAEPVQDTMPEAGWTPERVSGLIDTYGFEDGSSSAIAVTMSPDEYLGLLANEEGRRIMLEQVRTEPHYGPLDLEKLRSSPPIILRIKLAGEPSNWQIKHGFAPQPMVSGHDGRHRMLMLKEAGITRVPVVVQLDDPNGRAAKVSAVTDIKAITPNRTKSDQLSNGDMTGAIRGGVPISWKFKDQINETGQRVLFQSPTAPIFFSALERAVQNSPQAKASGEQWAATLRKTPGVKQEELDWSGITDFLASTTGPITREQLAELLAEGGIQVEEITLGTPGEDILPVQLEARAQQLYDEFIEQQLEDNPDANEEAIRQEANGRWGQFEDAAADEIREQQPDSNAQFQSWTSDPSSPSYRELLLTLPPGVRGNPARAPSTHWDVEGVVAHTRFMDKTDVDGKKVMFIEEVQSDWHQKGRDEGYAVKATAEELEALRQEHIAAKDVEARALKDFVEKVDALVKAARASNSSLVVGLKLPSEAADLWYDKRKYAAMALDRIGAGQLGNEGMDAFAAAEASGRELDLAELRESEAAQKRSNAQMQVGIPEAPFKSSWPALVMKRIIRHAAENGYDRVAWTTGEEQASRYNLSQAVNSIAIEPDYETTIVPGGERRGGSIENQYRVTVGSSRATQMIRQQFNLTYASGAAQAGGVLRMSGEQVKETFGADLGKRLIEAAQGPVEGRVLEGADLKVGGEGMKAFYDRNLVNITNDIIKKYGAKVGPVELNSEHNIYAPDSPVTAKIRAAATKPGFDVTDKMKEAALAGLPLFQDKGEGPRGRTSLRDDGVRIIELFGNADRSTLLHETGHIWLEEMIDDFNSPDASDQVKKDMETIGKWFAANGAPITKSGFVPTQAHELFARGVERYFMEGKAPSIGLRGAFNTFKAWLLRIYGVVQNLHSPITPEVREVFDRLLATDEALADARNANATEPLFKTAEEAGMTEAEFADYQKRVGDARDEAYDALLYKTMAVIRRQRTSEMRDTRASIRDEAAQQINSQPQFRLLHLLRTGKWLGEPDRPETKVKLNTGWLIDNFGEDVLNNLPRGMPITSGDGETGDTIAEMVGMKSGAEVVHALVGMRTASDQLKASGETRSLRDVMIDRAADDRMTEKFGDPLNDGSIEEEAIAAINTARQGEIIAAEARQLAKRKNVLGVPTPYEFARDWARRTVSAGHVRDVASRAALQRYTRAANKAARAAEKAILDGDTNEAYRQKQAQLLNHALLAEAKAAADRIDKIVARMKKLSLRAAMKSVDPEYLDRVHMLLENYDFRTRTQRSIEEQEDFQKWAERQRARGYEVHIPPRLENRGDPYTRVSVQELESLNDVVESLIAVGRTKQKIKVAQAERDFSEWRDEAVARMSNLPDRKLPAKPINEERRGITGMAAELVKVETIAEELDGGPTGPFHDTLVLGATTAENLRHELRHRVLLPLVDMYHDLGRKYWGRLQEKVTIPELTWNTLNEGDPRKGTPVTITRSELLSIFMNMGNLSNLEKLSRGERWPVDTLRSVMDRELTKEDFDFAQKMWDQVEYLWPEIVKVEREMSGVVPEKVVNSPIETKFGTYRGGYWPVVYDAARWQVAEDLEGKEIDDMFGLKSGVATQKGHTITRTGAFGPINLSLEKVLFSHIEQVVTRIAYAPFARDIIHAIRDRSIRGMIDTKLGPEYRKQIEPWLARQIHNGHPFPKGARYWDHLMRQFRINLTVAAMGFRFSTGTAQTLGLAASAQRIGPYWVGVGLKRLASEPRAAARFAYEKSPELLHRTEAVNREVAEVANRMRQRHNWWTEAQHWALFHIGMIDRYMVSLPTWLGAYEKARTQNMTDPEAVAFADKAVRMSQGTGREKDMAAVQSPNSEAMRFFTMFYTPWNVMFNAQWQGVQGLRRGDPRPLIATTFWWVTVQTLGSALMGGDWPNWDLDPEAENSIEKWFARNVFFGLFAGIPVVRDFATYAQRKVAGQYATEPGTTPITRVGDAVDKAWNSGKRKITKGENPKEPIRQVSDLAAILLGQPLSQPGATAQFLWDVHTGESDPKSVSDWYFGLTKGKVPEKKGEKSKGTQL